MRRDEALEPGVAHELEREVEGRAGPLGSLLDAVSVGATQLDLTLPQRRQVHSHDAGHADEDDLASRAGRLRGSRCSDSAASDAVDDDIDAAGETLDLAIARFEGEGT